MTDLSAHVRLALPYLADNLEDDEVAQLLQQNGFTLELAEKCVAFIPLAFGRLVLHGGGAKTTNTYCLAGKKRPKCGLLLAHEPVYQAALQVGQQDVDNASWNKNLHQLIATRSAEFHACNQLLLDNPSAQLTDIAFTEPYIILSEGSVNETTRPWWRFW